MQLPTDWFKDTADVQVIDNFLTGKELEDLTHHVKAAGFTFGWKSNQNLGYAHWNHTFAGRDKHRRDPVESYLDHVCSPVVSKMKHYMPSNARIIRCYSNAYTYGTEGYPHTDSNYSGDITAMVYLNDLWDRAWAGETVFFDEQEIVKSVMPKYGRLVLFHSEMLHAARSVSRVCPDARIVFVVKAKTHD